MAVSSLQAFRTGIEAVTTDLGGSKHMRMAVATAFQDALKRVLVARLGLRGSYDLPFDLAWTLAEDADLDDGMRQAMATSLRPRTGEPAIRRAPWRGADLVQRGGSVFVEGRSHALLVAMAGTPDRGYLGRDETVSVFLSDNGRLALWGRTMAPSANKPTSVTVRSVAASDKALVRLVSGFFAVEMEGVPDPSPAPPGPGRGDSGGGADSPPIAPSDASGLDLGARPGQASIRT